jgi:hypothetical protein
MSVHLLGWAEAYGPEAGVVVPPTTQGRRHGSSLHTLT